MPEIRLYNEDCIAAMKKVEDKSISLIWTIVNKVDRRREKNQKSSSN